MNQENADKLYDKLEKSVPKMKRENLKANLKQAGDSKYEEVFKIKLNSKGFFCNLNVLTAFFATLIGALFICLNMVVFMCVHPMHRAYNVISTKISDQVGAYYSQVNDYGKIEGVNNSDDVFIEFSNEYLNSLSATYDKSAKAFDDALKNYNDFYTEYKSDVEYVNNKTNNYLYYLKQLQALKEPQTGDKDYEKLKEEYDKNLKTYNEKIAEYEKKAARVASGNSQELFVTVNGLISECEVQAAKCADVFNDMIAFKLEYEDGMNEDYKLKTYGAFYGNYDGFTVYLDKCKKALEGQLDALQEATKQYNIYAAQLKTLPEKIEQDIVNYDKVYELWQSAKTDLKGFSSEYLRYKAEFDDFKNTNADDLLVCSKLSADLEEVIFYLVNGEKHKYEDSAIAISVKALTDNYGKKIDELKDDHKDTTSEYLDLKNAFDRLKKELDEDGDGKLEESDEVLAAATVKLYEKLSDCLNKNTVYTVNLNNYNKIVGALEYSNELISYNDVVLQIEKLNEQKEIETDADKIKEINEQLENLGKQLETQAAGYEEIATIYNEIFNTDLWTVEYYLNQYQIFDQLKKDKDCYETLNGALDAVVYKSEDGGKKNRIDSEIVASAKELLKKYENELNKFDPITDKENAGYILYSKLYSLLVVTFEGKENSEQLSAQDIESIALNVSELCQASKDWLNKYNLLGKKLRCYEAAQNAEGKLSSRINELTAIFTDKLNYGIAPHYQKQYEYDGINAYYNAEQITIRLSGALNLVPEILQPVVDYYSDIKNDKRFTGLDVSDSDMEKVLSDLHFDDYMNAISNYINGYGVNSAEPFAAYDATTMDVALIRKTVKDLGFEQNINSYKAAVNKISELSASSAEISRDYLTLPKVLKVIIMVYDIIVITVFALYFAYIVSSNVARIKEENYKEITNALIE